MGKSTILDHAGEGLYTVTLDVNTEKAEVQKTDLTAQIADLTVVIADLETEYAQTQAAEPDADDLPGRRTWQSELDRIQNSIGIAELQRKAFQQRLDYLTNNIAAGETENVSAWCADYTLDLSGTHATVEVIREFDKGLNIRPGYESRSVYDEERDGQLEYPIVNVPVGAYYNWSMFPGFQRWKPIYRYGILTAINKSDDTCTLIFEPMDSRAGSGFIVNNYNGLPVVTEDNPNPDWIPIEYMDCNSQPFFVDDYVLVEFPTMDWHDAKVIGYKDHPQPCTAAVWWIRATDPLDSSLNDHFHVCFNGSVDEGPETPPGGQLILTGPPSTGSGTPWYGTVETVYVITDQTIVKLDSLPEDILTDLIPIKNTKYLTETLFDAALVGALGAADADLYKSTIKKQAIIPFSDSVFNNAGHCRRLTDNTIVPGTKIALTYSGEEKAYTYFHTINLTGGKVKALSYNTGQQDAPTLRYIVEIHGYDVMCVASDMTQYAVNDWVFVAHSRNQNHAGSDQTRTTPVRERIETRIIEQINALRAAAGVQPLVANSMLTEAAVRHSEDMRDTCFIGHDGSDGSSEFDRITDTGFYRQTLIENAAISSFDPTGLDLYEQYESEIFVGADGENVTWVNALDDAIDNWELSPLHLKLLLAERLTSIGIGCARLEKEGACTVTVSGEKKIRILAQAGTYLPDTGYIPTDQEVTLPYATWYQVTACFGENVLHCIEDQLPEKWLSGSHDADPSWKPTEYFDSEWKTISYPTVPQYGYRSANAVPGMFPVILPLKIGSDFSADDHIDMGSDIEALADTVIINAKILRIHRENLVADPVTAVTADLKTWEYGTGTWLEDVPFHYSEGHKAFKIYDEVLLLVKGARGYTGDISALEMHIVGFADGYPRKALTNYLVARTRYAQLKGNNTLEPFGQYGYYYYGGFCPTTAYMPDDAVMVWDIANDELYQDCKEWNSGTDAYDIPVTFPIKYADFYTNTDFKKKHALVSDCPGMGRPDRHWHTELPPTLRYPYTPPYPDPVWGDIYDRVEMRIITYEDYINKAAGYYTRQNPLRQYYYRPIVRAFEFVSIGGRYDGDYGGVFAADLTGALYPPWSGFVTQHVAKVMNAKPTDYIPGPGYNSSLYSQDESQAGSLIAPAGFDAILDNDYIGSRIGIASGYTYPGSNYYDPYSTGQYADESAYLTKIFWGEKYYLEAGQTGGQSMLIGPTYVILINAVDASLITSHKASYALRREWSKPAGVNWQLDAVWINPEHDHSAFCNYGKIITEHYPEILPSDRAPLVGTVNLSADFVTAYKNLLTFYWIDGTDRITADCPLYVYD